LGSIFTKEWVYITIISEYESRIRINAKFKENQRAAKTADAAGADPTAQDG
jgi:hypothetical protein